MNDVLEVFLKEIPQILHEPIAVAGLIGVVLAAVFYARRPFGKFYWLILATIFYMFIWRLAIQIISSRYAEILLYPALIASAYACFKFSELVYPLFKKFIPEKLWRLLPYGLVMGLCIACLCKTIRLHPYDPIRMATQIIRTDSATNGYEKPLILSEGSRSKQYRYYAKLPAQASKALAFHNNVPNEKKIRAVIKSGSRGRDVLYIVCLEKTALKPVQLKIQNREDSRWKYLGQEYVDRRKRKVLRVYRYQVK